MKITDDSTLNKLILLYVFEAMDVPLTGRTIIEMCSSRNLWLTYMDCMVAVNELLDSGLIYRSSKEKIVEKGINFRRLLQHYAGRKTVPGPLLYENSVHLALGNNRIRQTKQNGLSPQTGILSQLLQKPRRNVHRPHEDSRSRSDDA